MAIDRPPSFSFPYLPLPPTMTLTSSLDATSRLLYILLHANYAAMYRYPMYLYVRYCMSQVRYNIIFPNAGWALPFAMTTNVPRQQPLATAFGTCTAILLPLAHPGSSTHCYCNNCNPRRCTAVAVAPGPCYNTNGGSCRALHAAWLHKRFAVYR